MEDDNSTPAEREEHAFRRGYSHGASVVIRTMIEQGVLDEGQYKAFSWAFTKWRMTSGKKRLPAPEIGLQVLVE